MLELHSALRLFEDSRVVAVGDLSRLLDEVKDSRGAGERVLKLGYNAGNLVERLGVLVGVGQKAGKSSDRKTARDRRERSGQRNSRVNDAVDKAGRRIGDRREEYRPQRRLAKPLVDLVELLLRALLVAERLNDLLTADHLVDKRGLLSSRLGLESEHIVGVLCDESRGEQRERRYKQHDEGYSGVYREHEADRSEYRRGSRKELRKAHQQSVGKGVGVGDDAADDLARRVRVEVGERQALDLFKGFVADIADDAVGDPVVQRVHQPLSRRDESGADGDFN